MNMAHISYQNCFCRLKSANKLEACIKALSPLIYVGITTRLDQCSTHVPYGLYILLSILQS